MKIGIMSLGFGVSLIIFVAIFSALFQDNSIKRSMDNDVNTCVMSSLKESSDSGADLRTTFETNLHKALGDKLYSGVSINYIASDISRGILSVEVTKSYTVFGKARTYVVSRCVIREKNS